MPNLVPTLLPRLEAARLPGLDAGPGAFYPSYAGYSLANIPHSICRWLGVPGFGIQPLAPEILEVYPGPFQHVILLLVDGLGLNKLGQFLQSGKENGRYALWQRLVGQGLLTPLTSIVPSTTTAALTTLWTGRTPAEHGVVGYEMYLKEYQMNANMILHAPAAYQGDVGSLRRAGFDPETFLPVPTLGPHLAVHGINTYAFQHISIAHSGLSSMLFPQVNVLPFRTLSDLWVSLPEHQQAHAGERTYTYIYWGELDELSHRFGPEDPRVDLEFANFTFLLGHFLDEMQRSARRDTLLLVSADHGHLHTPKYASFELKNHPELDSYLQIIPSGENRLAYLFARPGCEGKIQAYLEQALPGRFVLIPSEQVRASGLLGGGVPAPRLAERMGEFVLVAQDEAYLWWAAKENPLLGRHGGLSHTEMFIPLIGTVL
jgi:predicted AlkP superfamily pyrophosphatase or phosphodiesterase